ncbi:MAG: PHB depolymerase family esterase [Candidatus Ozemobacteraceae bacterium]
MMVRSIWITTLFLLCLVGCPLLGAHVSEANPHYLAELQDSLRGHRLSGTFAEVKDFGSNPGGIKMYSYVPSPKPTFSPLVVVLHGCTQTARDIAATGGWNELADRFGFIVLFPEQVSRSDYKSNPMQGFNWFKEEHIMRGTGEAESIHQMIDRMKTDHSIDPKRVFVTGLSAGGAMTAVMCCAYPDVFAGGAVMAGIPYRAAGSNDAFMVMFQGKDLTPAQWAKMATDSFPGYSGQYPRMSIFHGTKDTTVTPVNMRELVDQFTALQNTDQTPDLSEKVKGFPHKMYKNTGGNVVVETYEIIGMPHGIAVDPGTDLDQGGAEGSFAHATGLFSSYYALKFWGVVP